MIDISDELEAWLALPATLPAYCLSITRKDGTTVRGTSWQADLTIDGDVYAHAAGAGVSDLESEAALSVGNSEIQANFDVITDAHLKAGIYAGSAYEFFMVNPADLTMGRLTLMSGTTGQWTLDRINYKAELRSLTQSLQQPIGRVCTPTCPYSTYDDDCGVDEATHTESGTLDGVSADQLTFRDAARTEAGPTGGVAITAITNANPAHVTTATALSLPENAAVTLSAIVGPIALSGTVTIHNVSGTSFDIGIDTTDTTAYPAFVSGTCTPMGAESGFFDKGLMRLTSGANNVAGLRREVKSSVPGQWTLQQAFPFPVVGNETYELTWGDDHTFETCRDRFNNAIRFGGDPYVPGRDSIIQVARKQ